MTNVTNLRDRTRLALNNRPASLPLCEIAVAIRVSESWLRLFSRGKIENPGVVTIETLNEFLKNYKKKGLTDV